MVKLFKLLVVCLLLFSCKNKVENDYLLDVNNKELVNQIREYKLFSDSVSKGKRYTLHVFCYEINDTTNKFVVMSNVNSFGIEKLHPFHFMCKIDNYDVYFTMLSGIVESPDYGKTDVNFFKLKKSVFKEFVNKNFPEDEKYYNKYGFYPLSYIYEPPLLHLTFIRDKLVKKMYRRGSFRYSD